MRQEHLATKTGLLWALAVAVSGCNEIQVGVEAYQQGNFKKAVEILEPFALEQSKASPAFTLSIDSEETLLAAIPKTTQEYFRGWEAYVGSLFGTGEIQKGCRAAALALRPIVFTLTGSATRTFDPHEGAFWQAEALTIRSWWTNIPCQP